MSKSILQLCRNKYHLLILIVPLIFHLFTIPLLSSRLYGSNKGFGETKAKADTHNKRMEF